MLVCGRAGVYKTSTVILHLTKLNFHLEKTAH